MAWLAGRDFTNYFCSMTTLLLLSVTGTNRPRKIHLNTVLISLPFFVFIPVSFLLNEISSPLLIRTNCLSISVLLLLTNSQIKQIFPNTFFIFNVCMCYTSRVKVFLLRKLITDFILVIVLLRFPKNSTKSVLSSFILYNR